MTDNCKATSLINVEYQCPSIQISGTTKNSSSSVERFHDGSIKLEITPFNYYSTCQLNNSPVPFDWSINGFSNLTAGLYTVAVQPREPAPQKPGDALKCHAQTQQFVISPFLQAQDGNNTPIYDKGTYTVCASKGNIPFTLYVNQLGTKTAVNIGNLYWQLNDKNIDDSKGASSQTIDVSNLDATQNHTLKIIQQFDDGSENEVYSCTLTVTPTPKYYITKGNNNNEKFYTGSKLELCMKNTAELLQLNAENNNCAYPTDALVWKWNNTEVANKTGVHNKTFTKPEIGVLSVYAGNTKLVDIDVTVDPCDCAGRPNGNAYLSICGNEKHCYYSENGVVKQAFEVESNTCIIELSTNKDAILDQPAIDITTPAAGEHSKIYINNRCSGNNKFLLPGNIIAEFSNEQLASIQYMVFDGKTLEYFVDNNNNVFERTQRFSTYQPKENGNNVGKPLVTKEFGFCEFINYKKLQEEKAVNPKIKSETLPFKDKTITVWDGLINDVYGVPYPDFYIRVKVAINAATEGTVINAPTSATAQNANTLYCSTLTPEDVDLKRGATDGRDKELITSDLHLEHASNLPDWSRSFCQKIYDALISECAKEYLNKNLDELHKSATYLAFEDEAKRETVERAFLAYHFVYGLLYCATDENKFVNTVYEKQFAAGMLHEFISSFDNAQLILGAANGGVKLFEATQTYCKEVVESGKLIDFEKLCKKLISAGEVVNNFEIDFSAIKEYALGFRNKYFTDCEKENYYICGYRHGELTTMVLPILFTAGVAVANYSIAKLEGRLGKRGIQWVGSLDDLVSWASKNGLSNLSRTELDDIFKFVDNNFDFAKRVANSTKEIQTALTLTELAGKLNLPITPIAKSLTPYQTRVWYSWRKAKIGDLIDKTQTLENQAKQALNLRNEIRSGARQGMKDSDIADFLDSKELNMTWEQATIKYNGDYDKIIEASMRGRPTVDNVFKIPTVK